MYSVVALRYYYSAEHLLYLFLSQSRALPTTAAPKVVPNKIVCESCSVGVSGNADPAASH